MSPAGPIFVRRPSGNFEEARYADLTLPSVTLHEAIAARRALLAADIDVAMRARGAAASAEAADVGYLTPVQGALLQEAIDVAVLLNALRALRISPSIGSARDLGLG